MLQSIFVLEDKKTSQVLSSYWDDEQRAQKWLDHIREESKESGLFDNFEVREILPGVDKIVKEDEDE
jgi:hypothetical protein